MRKTTNIVFILSIAGLLIVSSLFIHALFMSQHEDAKEEPSIFVPEEEEDIIKEINNRKVASPKDAIRIYRNTSGQLNRPSVLQLEVTPERKGKITPLKYNAVD